MIRPKKIIITSNYHPSEIWEDSKTLDPVVRRVQLIQFGEQEEPTPWHHSYTKPL